MSFAILILFLVAAAQKTNAGANICTNPASLTYPVHGSTNQNLTLTDPFYIFSCLTFFDQYTLSFSCWFLQYYDCSSPAVTTTISPTTTTTTTPATTTPATTTTTTPPTTTTTAPSTPKCLTTSATVAAQFIAQYQKCYSLEAGPKTYVQAQEQCKQQGGTLAEPLYSDSSFYQNLVNAFTAPAISAITPGLYVGVSQVYLGNSIFEYVYNTNLEVIPSSNPIWQTTPALSNPAVGTKKVAYIATGLAPPYAWKLTPDVNGLSLTATKGFVCQYPVW